VIVVERGDQVRGDPRACQRRGHRAAEPDGGKARAREQGDQPEGPGAAQAGQLGVGAPDDRGRPLVFREGAQRDPGREFAR